MADSRHLAALQRIEAAMDRIDKARAAQPSNRDAGAGSTKLLALVNSHEKLREEVADTMRDLDALIGELEE